MAKSAKERLNSEKQSKKVVLDKNFAGIKAGQRMLVGTPKMIDRYIRKIPRGEVRTIHRLRNELARRNGCDATCPVSTAIFIRISAEAALEELQQGTDISDVAPFWRLIGPNDKITKKLNVDKEWIEIQREMEQ